MPRRRIGQSKKILNIKDQIKQFLVGKHWHEDKYGNMQISVNSKEYRIKFDKISLRYEVKVHYSGTEYSKPSSEWVRLKSGYYKDLSVSEKGIKGLKF